MHKIAIALLNVLFLAVISTCKAPLIKSLLRSKLVLSLPLLALCSILWSEDPLKSLVGGVILLSFTVFTICIAAEFEFQRQVELIMLTGAVALPLSIALALLAPSIGTTPAGWSGVFGQKQTCAARQHSVAYHRSALEVSRVSSPVHQAAVHFDVCRLDRDVTVANWVVAGSCGGAALGCSVGGATYTSP